MTTLLLIRHGACDAVGRYIAGRKEGLNLNEKGRRQVHELAMRLRDVPITRIFSSPLERTLETAAFIGEEKKVVIEVKEELNEVDYGDWTGYTFEMLADEPRWGEYNSFKGYTRIPGGEMLQEVSARMCRCIEEIRRGPDRVMALVSHGDPIKAALACYGGMPLDYLMRFDVQPASISILKIDDYGAHITCINDTGTFSL